MVQYLLQSSEEMPGPDTQTVYFFLSPIRTPFPFFTYFPLHLTRGAAPVLLPFFHPFPIDR